MILRRLAESIREQNWFTVALEIFIVVVGIFIGLQVDDWNERRLDRAEEALFLTELKAEIQREIEIKEARIAKNTRDTNLLAKAIAVVQSDDPGARLTPDQCGAAWRSSIISDVLDFRGLLTFAALAQSGRLQIISNPGLRSALLAYERQVAYIMTMAENISADMANITDNHADMFPRTLAQGETIGEATCRLDLIRASATVRNKMQSNLGRAGGITSLTQTQLDALRDILALLEGVAP